MDRPFITLENVTIRIRDRMVFRDTDWEIRTGQQWAILGPNGAGKSTLARVLINDIPYSRGTVTKHQDDAAGYVSFELQDWMINTAEMRRDGRSGHRSSPGRELARDALVYGNSRVAPGSPFFDKVVDLIRIGPLLDREVRFLSTGEIRKVLIVRALLKSPRLLILDEPLSGIDPASRAELTEVMNRLGDLGTQLILITNHPEEVLPCITHVLFVRDCKILERGKREDVMKGEVLDLLYQNSLPPGKQPKKVRAKSAQGGGRPLVELRNVSVRYGRRKILDRLSWKMGSGENWAITGPNGSGKTTLLKLITGDNLQGYSNKIFLFGRRKGSGEMLWETRQRIGFVSSEQLVNYRKTARVSDAVASGFFDSVGLYRNLSAEQKEKVRCWMDLLGIGRLQERLFDQTSYGEKRLVMIARALVKSPELLILDEPCEGLDPANRRALLGLVDHIGRDTPTDIIYVTHYPEELPGCITHKLELKIPQEL